MVHFIWVIKFVGVELFIVILYYPFSVRRIWSDVPSFISICNLYPFFLVSLARDLAIFEKILVSFNFYKCSLLGFLKDVHVCTMTQEDAAISLSLHLTIGTNISGAGGPSTPSRFSCRHIETICGVSFCCLSCAKGIYSVFESACCFCSTALCRDCPFRFMGAGLAPC